MFIRSERLFLRPIWPEDWQELYSMISDESLLGDIALVPGPHTAVHAQRLADCQQNAGCANLAITLLSAGAKSELVGYIRLHRTRSAGDLSDLALDYWIAKPHRGHGYSIEAAHGLLRLALYQDSLIRTPEPSLASRST